MLIVDDEPGLLKLVAQLLGREGLNVLTAGCGQQGIDIAVRERPDAIICDLMMPGLSGMDILRQLKGLMPEIPIIIMTGYASIQSAIDSIQTGAYHYIAKPLDVEELARVVLRAVGESALRRASSPVSEPGLRETSLFEMMGPSVEIRRLVSEVNRVAKSEFNVIILGETGAGKELVARAIHNASRRSCGPFVAVDCGAIPEALVESDLFGHEKGAFTGAIALKLGRFELARTGTLFLDEIGNLPIGAQVKLLRVLQEKVVCHVGGVKPFSVDVRLIAATNRSLDTEDPAQDGTFRQDLFYRLNDFTIHVPSLRERKGDIDYLARRFVGATSLELGRSSPRICEESLAALQAYGWPGNVRELRATMRRAVLLADDVVTLDHLDIRTKLPSKVVAFKSRLEFQVQSLWEVVKEKTAAVERDIIIDTIRKTGGNKALAARLLRIDYKTILSKIREYGISTAWRKEDKNEHGQ